jgi:uncharacterized C2H2 Zn-finger protein
MSASDFAKRKRKHPALLRTAVDCPVENCSSSFPYPSSLSRHVITIHGWGSARAKKLLEEAKNAYSDPSELIFKECLFLM